jgi:FdhD protein
MSESKSAAAGLRRVTAHRLCTEGASSPPIPEELQLAVEAPVTIEVHGFDTYTLLCTPLETEALAAGFLLTEGVIEDMTAVRALQPCADDPSLIRVRLHAGPPRIGEDGRNLMIVSSCGLCGVENIQQKLAALPAVGDRLRVECGLLKQVEDRLRDKQQLFSACGGTHAAGIFEPDGRLVAWAEDAGRHNALDKAIGKCLLGGIPTAGRGVALSGRASLDMVSKCARAGLELMVAVSAPTSLAVELAERCNITLCGFVRGTRATIFSHPRRVGPAST